MKPWPVGIRKELVMEGALERPPAGIEWPTGQLYLKLVIVLLQFLYIFIIFMIIKRLYI